MSNMTIHRIRLSKMQKIVNVLAVTSSVVSLAVVGTVGYVFVNKDAILDGVKKNVMESVTGGIGGGLGGDLPTGAPELAAPSDQASTAAPPVAPVQF